MTAREGRRFGFTVGIAFLVLAGIASWRGHDTTRLVLGGVGTLLVLAGLVLPAQLGPVYAAWMKLALLLSKVTTPLFMGLVYFVVLTPTGLARRLLGGNPLRARSVGDGVWTSRPAGAPQPESMTRQF